MMPHRFCPILTALALLLTLSAGPIVAATSPSKQANISPNPAYAFSCPPADFASNGCGGGEFLTSRKCRELCACNPDTGATECLPFGSCGGSALAKHCRIGECECKQVAKGRSKASSSPAS